MPANSAPAPRTQNGVQIIASLFGRTMVVWCGTALFGSVCAVLWGSIGLIFGAGAAAFFTLAAGVIQRQAPGLAVVYDPSSISSEMKAFITTASARLGLRSVPVLIFGDRGPAAYASVARTPVVVVNWLFAQQLSVSQLHAVVAHELGEHSLHSRWLRVSAAWVGGVLAAFAVQLASTHVVITLILAAAAILVPPALIREIEFAADRRALTAGADAAELIKSFDEAAGFERERRKLISTEPGITLSTPSLLAFHPRLTTRKRRLLRSASRSHATD